MTTSERTESTVPRLSLSVVCTILALSLAISAQAADLETAEKQFRAGQYSECLKSSREGVEENEYEARWRILLIKSLMETGQYNEAALEATIAARYSPLDLSLLKLAHTAYRLGGQTSRADELLVSIYRIASSRRLAAMTSRDLVALGQTLLELKAEPKIVLEEFYNRALQNDPNCREAYLAIGDLALTKQDFDLAATQFRKALERFGDDPDAHYGLARAFFYSDREAMLSSASAALVVNPHHAGALTLVAEHQIDCEDYDGAAGLLDKVIAVNKYHPQAWAYRAVLAHLTNQPNAEANARANALRFWKTNPEIDNIIGRKLSQKYRFAEGAEYQRQALRFDPAYLPAKTQLAEDLLRLGDEDRGWTLADEVHTEDPYNINAYNLVNLRDNMAEFATIDVNGIIVKMNAHEAEVYGDRVAELLEEARENLTRKYGITLTQPTTVELFDNQQDFAVRTFGMPGGDGYLGVCFGNVITANSPRAERESNWEATLWHEFAHVVTLNMTENKMPRWLSEGISVYEELQRNPTWGQRMIPQYRQMILGGELTPVSELSGAFMTPASGLHLQFAYYESSLVVEFLVERFGLDAIKAILGDLREGEEINAAITKNTALMNEIEEQFEAFARERAEALAPEVDWQQPDAEEVDLNNPTALGQWLEDHPNSFSGLQLQATGFLATEQWEQAKAPLRKMISLYPDYVGEGNAYEYLAQVHRQLGETDEEREVLDELASHSADASAAYARLMEISENEQDWSDVLENGEKYLAVYPMLSTVYRRMGRASEELGRDGEAVDAYQRLLLLDPADPVDVNYRLARLLQQEDPQVAKRYILEALADAPRFRQGHRLFLDIVEETGAPAEPAGDTSPLAPVQENMR